MKLVWVDLETCGLSPNASPIIEIGMIVTNENLEELSSFEVVAHVDKDYVHGGAVDPFVVGMHTRSGLWERSYATRVTEREAAAMGAAWLRLHHLHGEKNVGPMCGSSVHFDRAFLDLRGPDLHKMFSYRNLDVSSLKEACRVLGIPDPSAAWPKAHTALDDLRRSIREFKRYQKVLGLGWSEHGTAWEDTWVDYHDK